MYLILQLHEYCWRVLLTKRVGQLQYKVERPEFGVETDLIAVNLARDSRSDYEVCCHRKILQLRSLISESQYRTSGMYGISLWIS